MNRKELRAYLLLYCANADYVETEEETNLIKLMVSKDEYEQVHRDFEEANDYQRIQRIGKAVEDLKLNTEEKENLLQEVMNLFLSDGKFDRLEKNIYLGLKHLFE